MQALDTTIANVALPYMQGTLSASQDQINWVLTSYIVAAAIMTAPVGWIANRFGRKRIFILCSGGFTIASVLCGLAQDINQMVLFRLLQGVFGAGAGAAVAGGDAGLLCAARARQGDVDLGHGRDDGPDHGAVAGRLADRDLFLALGVLRQTCRSASSPCSASWSSWMRPARTASFASTGSGLPRSRSAIGSLSDRARPRRTARLDGIQRNHRRVHHLGSSASIISSRTRLTTSKPFIQFAIFKDKNFVGGCVFMAVMGLVLFLDHGAVVALLAERDRLSCPDVAIYFLNRKVLWEFGEKAQCQVN